MELNDHQSIINPSQSSLQSQNTMAGDFDFGFEPGNFFDKDLVNEYAGLIESSISKQTDAPLQSGFLIDCTKKEEQFKQNNERPHEIPTTSQQPQLSKLSSYSDIDLKQGFRLSNWIKGDGSASYEDERFKCDDMPLVKKQKYLQNEREHCGFRTANFGRSMNDDEETEQMGPLDYYVAKKDQTRMGDVYQKEYRLPSCGKFRRRDSDNENEDIDETEKRRRKVKMYEENYAPAPDPLRSYSQLMYKKACLPVGAIASLYGKSTKTLGGVVKRDFKIPIATATILRGGDSWSTNQDYTGRIDQSSTNITDHSSFKNNTKNTGDYSQSELSIENSPTKSPLLHKNDGFSTVSSLISDTKGSKENKCGGGGDSDNKTNANDSEKSNLVALIEREILQMKFNVTWDDLAGLDDEKASIKEMVVWPMLRPDLFKGIRAPPRGLLLYGPPGTGKTLIGRCVASQAKATFFNVSASSLTSKWLGESEKLVRTLFDVARQRSPAVIFIDEIDSLMSQRVENENDSSRRVKNEFLQQLDGTTSDAEESILLIGATNRPQELDAAARRRFTRRIYVPLPNQLARYKIISRLLDEQKHDLTQDQMEEIANLTGNYSCADVTNVCKEAALWPLRSLENIETVSSDDIPHITYEHFKKSLSTVCATVSEKDIEILKSFHDNFGYNK